jgi:hypothetical protein
VDGTEIANSNISDLVSDAVRARKSFNPTGVRRFFQGLAKLNVPRDIAGNSKRWEELGEPGPSNSGTPPVQVPERVRHLRIGHGAFVSMCGSV